MKKLKYILWLLLIAFLSVLVYQNLDFFSAKYYLHIDLGIYQRTSPEWANGAIIAGFVGLGVFIVLLYYFSSLYGVYKAKKTIKELKNTLDARTADLANLKNELAALKPGSYASREVGVESADTTDAAVSEEIKTS